MREYLEAKFARESLNNEKLGKTLVQDEETLKRKGKRKLAPLHLIKYYERLEELKVAKEKK